MRRGSPRWREAFGQLIALDPDFLETVQSTRLNQVIGRIAALADKFHALGHRPVAKHEWLLVRRPVAVDPLAHLPAHLVEQLLTTDGYVLAALQGFQEVM